MRIIVAYAARGGFFVGGLLVGLVLSSCIGGLRCPQPFKRLPEAKYVMPEGYLALHGLDSVTVEIQSHVATVLVVGPTGSSEGSFKLTLL